RAGWRRRGRWPPSRAVRPRPRRKCRLISAPCRDSRRARRRRRSARTGAFGHPSARVWCHIDGRAMYKPPERQFHPPPPARAPTAEEAAVSRLFAPLRLPSGLELRERTWVPAMVPWRATEDGFVTRDVLDWYARFAEGQPGALVVEATGIRDIASGPLLRIGHDRFIPGLRELVETVRRASHGHTRLFIQIIDFLAVKRRPQKEKFFARFLAVKAQHRAALAEATGDTRWLAADESAIRRLLTDAPDELIE